ncbi:MAG TPA: hypothetical protein GXZ86_01675 [Clostridiales bacterium]|jgi:hypothetical protein|nr:hypothetical protein [Clostridiales bacterium]
MRKKGYTMTKQELMALGLSEEAADKVLKDHVPYDRFKQVNEEKKAAEAQIAERDKAIEALNAKVKAGEDAASSIAQLQEQLKAKDAAVQATRKDAAIALALTQAKAKNTKAALALLDTGKLELQEDGTVKGLQEAIEGLVKSDAYLFDTQEQQPPSGGFNPPPAGSDPQQPVTFQDAVKQAYENQMKG